MADPYWRYAAAASSASVVTADRGSVPMPNFPGYLPTEASSLAAHPLYSNLRVAPSDYLQKDILPLRAGAYGLDGISGYGVRADPGLGVLPEGASLKSYAPPLEDPSIMGPRRDVGLGIAPGISPVIPDLIERPSSLRKVDGLPATVAESNVLFVDGLPNDCTRREVGHLFRPFIGFKEIRVVHKEPRRSGDKALVLCFVEFNDSKCALTALEALQGYKFDDKKPESLALRIQFAHFPFRLPSDRDRDEQRFGALR